jgi:hypothetical protein
MEQATEKAGVTAKIPNACFELTFNQKVTRDELIATLDKMLGMIGCVGCGLNGHEFHLHSERVNPALDKLKTKLLDGRKALVNVEVFDQNARQF